MKMTIRTLDLSNLIPHLTKCRLLLRNGTDALTKSELTCQDCRGETIRVNAVLRIAFECIAIYCHIAIFDWILVKTFHMGIWVLAVKKRIYTLYNCIKT